MAGRTKKPSGWGGKRAGSGPKKKEKGSSEYVKDNYITAAEKLAKKHKKTIEEALLEMMFDQDVQDTVKASIAKTYNDALISRETEQNINVTQNSGPAIGLPPSREDPALKVVKGGKKEG
jgi:hypothetical protein